MMQDPELMQTFAAIIVVKEPVVCPDGAFRNAFYASRWFMDHEQGVFFAMASNNIDTLVMLPIEDASAVFFGAKGSVPDEVYIIKEV